MADDVSTECVTTLTTDDGTILMSRDHAALIGAKAGDVYEYESELNGFAVKMTAKIKLVDSKAQLVGPVEDHNGIA